LELHDDQHELRDRDRFGRWRHGDATSDIAAGRSPSSGAAILDTQERAAGGFNLTSTARSRDLVNAHDDATKRLFSRAAPPSRPGSRRFAQDRCFGATTLSWAGTKALTVTGSNIIGTFNVQTSRGTFTGGS